MALVATTPLLTYRSNNTIVLAANSVTLQSLAANAVVVTAAAGALGASNATATELGYLRGLTSNIVVEGGLVDLDYTWTAAGPATLASPLTFTPLPQRAYWVEGRVVVTAEAPDYTAGVGVRWPSPLSNVGGGVTIMYQASTASALAGSTLTTDPMATWSTATLANVSYALTLQATFTTANTATAISPFALIANTSAANRNLYFGAGSHLAYRATRLVSAAPT